MKIIYKILLYLWIILIINGCAAYQINSTVGHGTPPHAKKEMINYQKKRNKEKRIYKIKERKRRKEVWNAQQKPWK